MGRRADYFQNRIPSQRIGEQLSMDASVISDEYPNHFLPRTRNRLHRPSSGASARKFEKSNWSHVRKERISSPPPQISWSQKVEKNFVLSGEVNVNQRQDGNGATGTTRSSLSQVPRGCNGTVKVFATFVYLSVTSGTPDFRCSNGCTVCDLFEPTPTLWLLSV